MNTYTYIKKSIPSKFVEFNEPLNADLYNNIGESWKDYLDNKWVLLSDEQVAFHAEHPTATASEVWNMELERPTEPTLDDAKRDKIMMIEEYDKSSAVNSFSINGRDMWLTVEERQQIATQISANEAVGRETMTKWFEGVAFTFPIDTWKQMLVALEVYAGDALNVTESHKSAVNALESIEAVEAYDYMTGYPNKLNF